MVATGVAIMAGVGEATTGPVTIMVIGMVIMMDCMEEVVATILAILTVSIMEAEVMPVILMETIEVPIPEVIV